MIKYLIGIFLCSGICLCAQDLQFVGEDIDFSINENRFYVNGLYCFANNGVNPIRRKILFPIPLSKDNVKVEMLLDLENNRQMSYTWLSRGLGFNIFLAAGDTCLVHLSYSQSTSRENRYILESTKSWKRPLEYANYSLRTAEGIHIDSISLEPDSIFNGIYFWNKTDFMPVEDMVVYLKIEGKKTP